ncbi:MAG: hypothetical protein M1429_00990 [Patescibacteria group bacterium]|nr:hypothetical protein [Patescibacteria group bacterium]
MIITPHLLAGSAVAAATTNSWPLAFLIGFFLHFVLDAVPHVDPGTFQPKPLPDEEKKWPLWIYIYALSEFVVIWAVVIILFQHKPNFNVIMAGGMGGIAVDILENNPFRVMRTWPILKQIQWVHEKIHYDLPKEKWFWGAFPQIIVVGISIWYLLKY